MRKIMENIIIRNIEEKDIPSVVDIQIDGWKTAYKGIIDDNDILISMNRDERIERRKKDYKENGFIVAQFNNEVVGFCRYIDNNSLTQEISDVNCELLSIYVKPNFKYRGIGTKMFRFVQNKFKRKNKAKMILWCLKDNKSFKKFYTKMGGKIIKEREVKIGDKIYVEIGFLYII